VRAYKSLARVERAFRCLKTTDLDIRPIYHYVSRRVRAHVSCACSPIISNSVCARRWHQCCSRITSARPRKKRTDDGQPIHSFRTLLADLAALVRNIVRFGNTPDTAVLASPTEIQQRVFDLLGVKLQM
jgi:hypothetical protein